MGTKGDPTVYAKRDLLGINLWATMGGPGGVPTEPIAASDILEAYVGPEIVGRFATGSRTALPIWSELAVERNAPPRPDPGPTGAVFCFRGGCAPGEVVPCGDLRDGSAYPLGKADYLQAATLLAGSPDDWTWDPPRLTLVLGPRARDRNVTLHMEVLSRAKVAPPVEYRLHTVKRGVQIPTAGRVVVRTVCVPVDCELVKVVAETEIGPPPSCATVKVGARTVVKKEIEDGAAGAGAAITVMDCMGGGDPIHVARYVPEYNNAVSVELTWGGEKGGATPGSAAGAGAGGAGGGAGAGAAGAIYIGTPRASAYGGGGGMKAGLLTLTFRAPVNK
jgi:hypothetical protein